MMNANELAVMRISPDLYDGEAWHRSVVRKLLHQCALQLTILNERQQPAERPEPKSRPATQPVDAVPAQSVVERCIVAYCTACRINDRGREYMRAGMTAALCTYHKAVTEAAARIAMLSEPPDVRSVYEDFLRETLGQVARKLLPEKETRDGETRP